MPRSPQSDGRPASALGRESSADAGRHNTYSRKAPLPMKGYLIIAVIAVVAIAIVNRIGAARNIVFPSVS